MSSHRLIRAILAATVMLTMAVSDAAAGTVPGSPRVLNPYFAWGMEPTDMPMLAKWDVVVLDADQSTNHPELIRKLREYNPKIKILAYIATEEISDARFGEPQNYPNGWLAAHMQPEWYVHDPQGNQNYFWPGSRLVNVTDQGPAAADGTRWNQFLPQFIHEHILSTGMWDGVFLDNCFSGISYFAKLPVDLNRDGVADPKDLQNRQWQLGMEKMIARIHQQDPQAMLIGNGDGFYASKLNGSFFESFPSYNWATNWQEVRTAVGQNISPSLTTINVNTGNTSQPTNYQLMRYGLTSALVAGSVYSFDSMEHHTLWWYDEYDVPLGAPRAAARALVGGSASRVTTAVWARDFARGIAVVNSTNATQRVTLPGVFERIRGTQDPQTNNGILVTSLDLASHDGAVLLRQSEPQEIVGSAYINGTFMRIMDSTGKQIQNGFFAQRTDVPSGVLTMTAPLSVTGGNDVVTASGGRIRIVGTNGAVTTIQPFEKAFTGEMFIAAGNTNHTDEDELVVGRGAGSQPEVAIFSRNGKALVRWLAYQPRFTGGVRVAIGDLDGNGMREIVTGAGPGGGPHVRIWKTDGTVWGGSFFAFDQSERGGVQIAVGDVDGDGKDEIVAASGEGAVPRVRIFDGRGTLKREIKLGSSPVAGGLQVSVTDINGDGIKEILVSGLPLF